MIRFSCIKPKNVWIYHIFLLINLPGKGHAEQRHLKILPPASPLEFPPKNGKRILQAGLLQAGNAESFFKSVIILSGHLRL
jgi:hypothetical protein